jgi:ankyrin repeat protein
MTITAAAPAGGAAKTGITPLHYAIFTGKTELFFDLLGRGADVNASDEYGNTVAHMGAYRGSAPIVEALLAAGANPKAVDANGNTLVHAVAGSGSVDVLDMLVTAGAPPCTLNAEGKSPLDICRVNCHPTKKKAMLEALEELTLAADHQAQVVVQGNQTLTMTSLANQSVHHAQERNIRNVHQDINPEDRGTVRELTLAADQQRLTLQRLESQLSRVESMLIQLSQRFDGLERASMTSSHS